jgi:hypothetical protein
MAAKIEHQLGTVGTVKNYFVALLNKRITFFQGRCLCFRNK